MDGTDAPKEFPDISQKLAAPKKLSAYEKERQAAQAKQQRAEAENAAALKAFESSFGGGDDQDDGFPTFPSGKAPPPGPRRPSWGYGTGGSYGMPPGGPRSGPGSLGPIPGPPPPSMKRKRALEEMREAQEARREQEELLDYEREGSGAVDSPPAVAQDQEVEVDVPRPTIELSSLPPDMVLEDVKRLLKDHLEVFSIRLLTPTRPGPDEKIAASAVVTLAPHLTTAQIDTAMTALKKKYLGRGFYLSSRHHSAAALHPSISSTAASTEPFGAESRQDPYEQFSLRNAPPPMDQRGFAPPEAYGPGSDYDHADSYQDDAVVSVRPPPTLEEINAVNSVVDHLLSQPDPARAVQAEAMLMLLPEVQSDERFAFLYDSQSPAGIYYRYQLWAPDAADDAERNLKRRDQSKELIHEDVPIVWHPPYTQVPFPDLQSLQQVVEDTDYSSSDEESDDEGAKRQFNSGRENDVGLEANEKQHLTPLQRARLTHLLARLPTSMARLRKGDVARVTYFAISHAGTGAEEIVDLLLLNIVKPFSYSLASKYEETEEQDEEDVYEPEDDLSALESPAAQPQTDNRRDDDPSNAKLIALYLISDILSASATAGAKNAWKYRQLFEAGFKAQQTFEYLGGLEKELAWGKMKAEQWKRKISLVFGLWEKWSVFSDGEKAALVADAEEEQKTKEKLMGRFKRVGSPHASASPVRRAAVNEAVLNDVDGGPMSEVDGAPMEGVDGAPLADGVDGEPMDDVDGTPVVDDVDGQPLGGLDGASDAKPQHPSKPIGNVSLFTPATKTHAKPSGPRKRMTAADMMAGDSDDDNE